ncbi:MAG: glycosyl hydrolase family 18 protein [Patescibacteria group bacterium]
MKRILVVSISVLALLAAPYAASATTVKFIYAGWIPYWQQQSGAMDIALNLEKVREVSPFSYEVNANGTLRDKLKIKEGLWPGWLAAVRDLRVKIIPTIAWFDGEGIHKLLTNGKLRRAHEDLITKLVVDNKFDGIDIDYEAKKAETKDYFSTFLKGLAIRLHPRGKTLSCTVEVRMPLGSLYRVIPKESIPRANDYVALNRYCDEVRIMAYDQGQIDWKLNEAKGNGKLYAPTADPAWVEKIIKEATKTISPKKLMLGIPTYGYEYEVSWENGVTTYRRLRSVNFFTAMNVSDRVGVAPVRNSAGELGFVYPSSTSIEVSDALRKTVSSTRPVEFPGLGPDGTTPVMRFLSFTDAEAINQKIKLAKKYGLRGAVFFKFDGAADPLLWTKVR